ncbi:MAG TPA: hydroxyisourate hydrolase [Gemmatimonadaceae bacterium]|jgi:5-hydroxyisourate hydrolase|nr:hydroxyisourate hydrolase [Gemmatimonadaceae bacterium]
MISTHVLDTARGRPATDVPVLLERVDPSGARREIARARTDADGRVRELVAHGERLEAGTYCLTFETIEYFAPAGVEAFYPRVTILFTVREVAEHYHVPLLLSPYGYSTYRGS